MIRRDHRTGEVSPLPRTDTTRDECTTSEGRAARRAGILRLLNHYRQVAGLTPVKLDRKLSARCMEHANYMVQNQGTDAMVGLNPHTQRSNLPGASAAGAACAKAADLFPGVSDLGVAIDAWMAGMYHRRPMLDPQHAR